MSSSNKTKQPKICWGWQEWMESRDARRAEALKIGPPVCRRKSSSSDKQLKALFQGKRGPDFLLQG